MSIYKRFIVVFSPKSTRARKYVRIRPKIIDLAADNKSSFTEIRLEDTPYFKARDLIAHELKDGDLVIAAGGDGTAQITFEAVYSSGKDATYATIPLGNGNDLSRALNRSHREPGTILRQSEVDLYPLDIYINGKRQFSLASYITFGATTVLVDYLNQESARRRRQSLRMLSPAAAVPVLQLNDISNSINRMEFPDFERDSKLVRDDSIGFFVVSAAHSLLRLPKDLLRARSEFFFHHAATKHKNLFQKIVMASAWSMKFPGELTDLEELKFADGINLTANVSGDNIDLGLVKKMGALRSQRPVRVLSSDV